MSHEVLTDKSAAQLALSREPVRLGVYRHYKGGQYIVFCVSLNEATLEQLVHYYSIEERFRWTRTREVFFEMVQDVPRFTFLRDSSWSDRLRASGLIASSIVLAIDALEDAASDGNQAAVVGLAVMLRFRENVL